VATVLVCSVGDVAVAMPVIKRRPKRPVMRSTSEATTPLRALIIQHEEPTPPGFVNEWLDEHGAIVETFRIDIDDRQVDPSDYDLIVSLGAECAAFDDSKPFVPREASLMRRAVDADIPVLGLCFGGQMLARVLGGHDSTGTMSRAHAEIGYLIRRLGRLLDALPSDGPQPDDVRDLQQALYGLYAILRLHFAQENEGYFSLLDADETLPRDEIGPLPPVHAGSMRRDDRTPPDA